MTGRIIPAIMSGGSGTRLWPLSTGCRPKQFHAIATELTLIEETALRLSGETDGWRFGPPLVIGAAAHVDLIVQSFAAIGIAPAEIILEPEGRNTAATAAIAAAAARRLDPESLVLLAPADHLIADPEGFRQTVARAAALAHERIVAFGVEPSEPETGYGYIQAGEPLSEGAYAIRAFKEKPQRETAERYLVEGGYFWNAGVFLFAPEILLKEFDAAPEIRDLALAAYAAADREAGMTRLPPSFKAAPAQPIDIAVMEKTTRGAVVPCRVGWADVGSWSEVWRLMQKDAAGVVAQGAVVVEDSQGALVLSSGPVVAVSGVEDIIVIATPEAVLVVPKGRAQEVKRLAEAARKLGAS